MKTDTDNSEPGLEKTPSDQPVSEEPIAESTEEPIVESSRNEEVEERPWTGWYLGCCYFGFRFGGFASTWFAFLRRFRAWRLGRRYQWLIQGLDEIPVAELRAVGPYWHDFARGLGCHTDAFAQSLGAGAATFAFGLDSHAGAFATGLGARAGEFSRGLGEYAAEFFEGLGCEFGRKFMDQLGSNAGQFLDQLRDPTVGFEAFGPDFPELIGRSEAFSKRFLDQLTNHRSHFFQYLGRDGILRWFLALYRSVEDCETAAARLIFASPEAKIIQDSLIGQVEDFVTALNRDRIGNSDQFLKSLGRHCSEFLLKLGPELRYFCQVQQGGGDSFVLGRPVIESMAAKPREFGVAIRANVSAVALSLSVLDSTFEELLSSRQLRDFMLGLDDQLGCFILRFRRPKRLLEALAAYPEVFFDPMSEEAVEEFTRSLGAGSGEFASSLGTGAYHFAQVIGPKIAAFGRGLGRHSREFIRQLGGREAIVEQQRASSFFGTIAHKFSEIVDHFRGNFYTARFLKALTLEQRRLWFEAIGRTEKLILKNCGLRCGLCHEELSVEIKLIQCRQCSTLIHSECLQELSHNLCPFDQSPAESFIEVKISAPHPELGTAVETHSRAISENAENNVETPASQPKTAASTG